MTYLYYDIYIYYTIIFVFCFCGLKMVEEHVPSICHTHSPTPPLSLKNSVKLIFFFFQFHEFFFFWTPPYVLSRPVFLKDSIFIISTFFRIKKPDRHTVSYFNVYTFSIWILLLRKMTKYLAFKRWFQYKNSIIRHFKKFLLFFWNCDLKKSPFFSV